MPATSVQLKSGLQAIRATLSARLLRPLQHPAAVRGLAAALEINGELPAMNGGQVEGRGLIVVHGSVALGGDATHFVWTNCYSLPTTCATPLR